MNQKPQNSAMYQSSTGLRSSRRLARQSGSSATPLAASACWRARRSAFPGSV